MPITEQAIKTDELMKQYSIKLSWAAVTDDELPLGSYIEYEGIRYSLLAPYKPQQSDEATFEYEPVFQHPVMRWQYLPFLFYTYNGEKIVSKEPDWSLTDNAANFMAAVVDAIKNITGEQWSYEIADNLPASASLSFNNTDIFSALSNIAAQFETEWWFDYANKVLYLSKASHGEEVVLEVGKNIGVPSITQSKEGYYTRFLVFGSTRNIEQEYKGVNTNSIVNRRLTLDPAKYPDGYIDIKEGLTSEEILSKTLVFDDIYPRSALTISDVKVALKWRLNDSDEKIKIGTDAEGNPVYDQYAVWYFKIPNFKYNEELVVPNKPLSIHFNNGPLQGREFELWYEDEEREEASTDGTAIRVEKGDYRIKYIEEGSFIIPAITGLIPVDGNSVTLFNIIMPEEYKASAYDELEKAALKEIAKQEEDTSNYSFGSNPVEFLRNNPNFSVGRKVVYKNGNYTYSTRIIKLETQLDRPFEQKITIGNEQIKGNSQTLKEDVLNANQNIDLIASINESTQQLVQSYQRTQKALQESMAKWGDMWQLDKQNNAVYTPLNLIVEGTIGMGSLGEGGSGEVATPNITIKFYGSEIPYTPDANGIITLPAYPEGGGSGEGGITQVTAQMIVEALEYVPYSSKNPSGYITSAALNGYATEQWVTDRGYITNAALADYAKKSDIPSLAGYATQQWVKQQGYLTQHQDLSAYAKSADVANTYATKVALQTLQNEHNALSTKVTNLDNLLNSDVSGVINTWGEVVDFLDEYSGSEDLATILSGMNAAIGANTTSITAVSNRVKTFEDVIGIDSNGDVYIKGTRNFYTAGGTIGMAGLGSGGSGGGGGTAGLGSVTVRVNGQDYITDASGIVTIPNYPTLAGYATEQYVTSRGYITADALTKANVGLGEVQNYGVFNQTSFKGKIQYAIVNSSVLEIANRIDFHVNEGSADYEVSLRIASGETTKRVIYLPSAEGTLALVSQIPTVPTALKSPYALTFGAKTYDGSEAKTITASDLDALSTSGGTISKSSYVPLVIQNTASDLSTILYKGASGDLGYLGFSGASNPVYMAPSGYAYTLIHTGNYADTTDQRYLQLSGGRLTDTLRLQRDAEQNYIVFEGPNNTVRGYLGFAGDNNPIYIPKEANVIYSLIHSGNIGSYTIIDNSSHTGDSLPPLNRYGLWQGIGAYIRFGALDAYSLALRSSGGILQAAITHSSTDATWFNLLHSGNYSEYALPLSGGTLTGNLTVNGGITCDHITRYDSNAGYLFGSRNTALGLTDGGALVYAYGNTPISMYTNGLERIRILGNGNVLIGTTTDSGYKLRVDGAISANGNSGSFGGYAYYWGNNNQYFLGSNKSNDFYLWSTTASHLRIGTNNQERVRITSSGNVEMYGNLVVTGGGVFGGDITSEGTIAMAKLASSSDRSLKDNIAEVSAEQSMSIVRQLRPTTWNWKKDGKKSYGLIAQDVEPIVPEMVVSMEHLHLEYNQLHAFEIGAIQHIDSEVELLKRRVTELENELKQYRRV